MWKEGLMKICIFSNVIPYSLEVFTDVLVHYTMLHVIPSQRKIFSPPQEPQTLLDFQQTVTILESIHSFPKIKKNRRYGAILSSQKKIIIRRMLSFDCLQVFVLANPRHHVPAGPT
jgi:hypothetical protein